jgi:quinol monooxygenase YgiN
VLDNEPGVVSFVNHRSRNNPDEYYIVEQYQDKAAADRHDQSDAFKAAVEKLMSATGGPAEHVGLDVIE